MGSVCALEVKVLDEATLSERNKKVKLLSLKKKRGKLETLVSKKINYYHDKAQNPYCDFTTSICQASESISFSVFMFSMSTLMFRFVVDPTL